MNIDYISKLTFHYCAACQTVCRTLKSRIDFNQFYKGEVTT